MTNADILVIGAGVIGISAALELQHRGHSVLVLDRDGVAAQASAGNAGAFAFADVEPLATPGIMVRAPKWLLDPLGPLSVPPAYALRIAPWMVRFWRASWRDRNERSITAQSRLMRLSKAALERQIAQVDGEHLMQRDGQLQLCEGQKEFNASLGTWDVRRRHEIAFTLLENRDAIAEIQPGLDPRFTHAGYTPDWMNTVDPKTWVAHLAQAFLDRGGRIEQKEISALSVDGLGARVTLADGDLAARNVIVAAGAWSHHLARTLGDHIPLET
ncbi:MAG: NAD(P)/FAD-dependent oxidoreductase, partial [Ruegeria sp.]